MTDIDQNVNQDVAVPDGSQPDQNAAGDASDASDAQQATSSQPDVQKTPEENEWNSLTGTTQDRVKKILRDLNEYKSKVTQQAQQDSGWAERQYQQPVQQTTTAPDEVERAYKTLQDKGMATRDDLYALVGQIRTERDHERLAEKYDGSDGLPRYDRMEVEDYMNRSNMRGNPEAAFRDMYFDEFVDSGKKQMKRKPAYTTEKPTASSQTARNEPMTLESFRQELQSPAGREKYAKLMQNPQKFDALIAQLTGQPTPTQPSGILG